MKSLDCNQIKIFINLEIIREEDKYKKNYIKFFKILKKFLQFNNKKFLIPLVTNLYSI